MQGLALQEQALQNWPCKTTTHVGAPLVKTAKVAAKVVQTEVKGDKLRIIRYKAKKRVHKETGHRQKYSQIQITSIK